jgi:hypothetical protein
MTEGLSAADVMAMTKDSDSGWMNNPFIYLVWLALLGNGGILGNRGTDAATQGALTRSDLFEGFNNQDVNGQLRGITSGICDGFYAVNNGLKDGFYGLQGAIAENRFAQQNCCCETNRNIDSVRYDMSKGFCDVAGAIHAEGEATRALINANTMQELRDRLEAKNQELQTANFQLSQQAQSANLIAELRPCAKPAYITCSPYTAVPFNTCGC